MPDAVSIAFVNYFDRRRGGFYIEAMTDQELQQALEATSKRRRLELVLEARRRGWSYARIGALLGVTRQSVYGLVDMPGRPGRYKDTG